MSNVVVNWIITKMQKNKSMTMIYTIALQINASRLERGHEEQKNVTKKTHFIHVLDNSPDVGS